MTANVNAVTMKALVMQGREKIQLVDSRPVPLLRPGYLLVRVVCIALNPTDWKHIDFVNTAGALCGCDYSGIVERTGTGYTKDWKVGDWICGAVHGANPSNPEDGAFAEYIVAKADVQYRMPRAMSFEEAATLGVALGTVGMGLFERMRLALPSSPITQSEPVLIYGGSTATGTLGIQFAKLAGYSPITACSQHNFELVRSLGAVAVFDYHDSKCAEQIKAYTNGKLRYAWDTISLDSSINICADALAKDVGACYGSLLPASFPRKDVTVTSSLLYLTIGDPFKKFGKNFEVQHDTFHFAKKFVGIAEDLLAKGRIRAHPVQAMEGGLEKVPEGLSLLRRGKVSGKKLVYKLS